MASRDLDTPIHIAVHPVHPHFHILSPQHTMKQATPDHALPHTKQASSTREKRDSERPLVEDIRLLGRILGDVIRTQEGPEAYELVEQIRKLSVAFRRDADHEADQALK